MKTFLSLPWGRAACVIGAFGCASTMSSEPMAGAVGLCGFLAAGVALHAIAAFRPR